MFYLFDFNGVGVLNLTDIEFMLDCCMSSIFKVYQITSDKEEPVYMSTGLGEFVMDNFSENTSIDYPKVSSNLERDSNFDSDAKMVLQKQGSEQFLQDSEKGAATAKEKHPKSEDYHLGHRQRVVQFRAPRGQTFSHDAQIPWLH